LDFNHTLAAFFVRPRRAAAAVARPERLAEGAVIYAAALAAGTLYYTALPKDLPKDFVEYFPYLAKDLPGPGFWFKMALVGTVFFAAEVAGLWAWVKALRGRAEFLSLLSLMCWIHVFYLFMFVGMQMGVWARNAELAHLSELTFTLWSLFAATVGLREIAGLNILKSFFSLLLSSLAVFLLLVGARQIGLLGPDELKILLLF